MAQPTVAARADSTSRLPVLIVEDDDLIRTALQDALATHGFQASVADSVACGFAQFQVQEPRLLVLDVGLPDGTGWDLLDSLRGQDPTVEIPVLMITGQPVSRALLQKRRIDRLIPKPFEMMDVVDAVFELLLPAV